MIKQVLFAGFGGQGVLFAGRVLANTALGKGYELSWLPSYGPETRGGTSNCAVVISDRKIGSPIVTNPDILVAMNAPSFDRFIDSVSENGLAIIDSSLIIRESNRDDITRIDIAATTLAQQKQLTGLANMILLGKLFSEIALFDEADISSGMKLSVSSSRESLINLNLTAIALGSSI
ncbi:MAG: 2-oxoacid:acceptor oxidoreductase family protein [Oscillospiraceae bacterium]|nr:2-oxoacid:acceptor oxidoreductase family protein [Oscillospiraceae bacterium]